METLIFDIQRGCTHDGPGIRTTVFFKGCPMRCFWCQNPESQSYHPELMHYKEKCLTCLRCVKVCDGGAVKVSDGRPVFRRDACTFCGMCEENCPADAVKIIGRAGDIDGIMKEIHKDADFYSISGGGVTLSGGEALSSPMAPEVLRACKKSGYHTAVETCGMAAWSAFEEAEKNCDLFLFDIKMFDSEKHKKYCGVPNDTVLSNLDRLKKLCPQKILLRMCVVPGINDDEKNIRSFFEAAKGLKEPELIPFHNWGKSKYSALERAYEAERYPVIDKETLDRYYMIGRGNQNVIRANKKDI